MRRTIGGLLLRFTRNLGLHRRISHARLTAFVARIEPSDPASSNLCFHREIVGALVCSEVMIWL